MRAMGNNCPTNVKMVVMDELLCKYTPDDDTNEQLMKLMEDALEVGYKSMVL
ncbi:hypothetical protein D8674_005920 [Pyrus ussuriensis x Pyrus communis]|uniref:Uncharacterized protein n=1 Tax=Pyrus ussuriensis x Pyrus communis TaxID=2448454 RepID=A0A5N5FT50_9ROSA|nr:hypothetical protein D8674_005920 [Pyrus ussuriensis x Pyrus communis]